MMPKLSAPNGAGDRPARRSLSVFGEIMNNLYLRSCMVLACAVGLAACGGGAGNLALSGNVIGLTKGGLVLQNGSDSLTISPTTGGTAQVFTFPTLLASDQAFEVKVGTQPQGAACTVTNGKGSTGSFNITSVLVTCITNSYNLGGHITGTLDVNGLILANGKETKAIPAGTTKFNMTVTSPSGAVVSGKVDDGAAYGITVFQQPVGRTCTVINGTGLMGSGDMDDAFTVDCH
jgi:hypothetical protein